MIARDITEKKRAQQAVKDSEERYRNLTENIDDFLYTFDKIGYTLRPSFILLRLKKLQALLRQICSAIQS